MIRIHGVNAALLTPFAAGGEPHWASVDRMVTFLVEQRIDGLFPASSTGEFARLTVKQRQTLVDRVAARAAGKLNLLPGCGAMTLPEVLELARHAQSAGCQAVIVCPPYYYSLCADEIAIFYQRICDASPLPVIPYNIPAFTSPIPVEVLAQTAAHPNVVAVKESSGNMAFLAELLRLLEGSNVDVLVGPDEFLFPALALGASGCTSGCSGIFPELVLELFHAFEAGKYENSRGLQFLLLQLMQEVNRLPFPYGLKGAMELRGLDMGLVCESFSAGMRDLYQEVQDQLASILRENDKARFALKVFS